MTRTQGPPVRVLAPDPLAPADRILLLVRSGDETDARGQVADWISAQIAGGFGDHFDLEHPPAVIGITGGVWRWVPFRDEDAWAMRLAAATAGPGAFSGFLVELGASAIVGRAA